MKNSILKNTNLVSYLCMIIGVFILFSQVDKQTPQSQYITIVGLIFLIVGVYTMAKKLPSKRPEDYKEPLVREEKSPKK